MRQRFFKVLAFVLSIAVIAPPVAFSAEGNGVPIGEPTAVQAITLGDYTGSTTTRAISWSAPSSNGGSAITGYSAVAVTGSDYTVESSATCSVNGSTTSCSIVGMAYGTSYKIRMIATNAVGPSVAAFSTAFTTPSISQTVTISGAPTSVNFGASPSQLSAVSRDASTTQPTGLSVTWSTTTSTVCSVDNNGLVTYLSTGTCTATATQDGRGTNYAAASASANITVGTTISASATGASSISGTGATLGGSVPYPGTSTSVVFCLATTNSNSSCGSGGGAISIASPSTITSSSGSTTSAIASGLTAGTTYYYWVEATGAGTTTKSSTASFTTLIAPALAQSGPTSGETGSSFSTTVTASSGSGVYTNWSANTLPAGLALSPNGSQATIAGTPTTAGSSTTVITVTDSSGLTANISITFDFTAPVPPPSTPTPQPPVFDTTTPTESPEEVAKRIADAEAAAKKAAEEAAKKAAEEAAKKAAEEAAAAKKRAEEEAAYKATIEELERRAAADEAARLAAAEEARLGLISGSTTPILTPDGKLPSEINPGSVLIIVDGKQIGTQYKIVETTKLQITYGTISLAISIIGPDGSPRTISETEPLKLQINDEIYLEGSGYLPDSKVTLWIFSTPIKLGELPVNKDGKFAGALKTPVKMELGPHTIQINGLDTSKRSVSHAIAALVVDKMSQSIDEAVKNELGTQTGPGFTTPALGRTITKGVLFFKNSATIITYEKKVIQAYRKIVARNSQVTCIGFTYAKKPSKSEISIARRQAIASCKYLLPAKNAKYKILIRDIKQAKRTGRFTSPTKKYPVNIQIATPRKAA
jgi:hypothetical protein